MILGIWTTDLSFKNVTELRKKGFNGIFFPTGWFWDQLFDGDYEQTQEDVVAAKLSHYEALKKMGFEYFLIDIGWGLGKIDGNYFYKKIIDAFVKFPDVEFYIGEPFIAWMENGGYSKEEVIELIEERKSLCLNNCIVDAPARQQDLYKFDALSSYMCQGKHWRPYHKFAWIYGSVTYTLLFGSLCYARKKKQLEKLGIQKLFLYQGDVDWITITTFNNYLQTKFIKVFGD